MTNKYEGLFKPSPSKAETKSDRTTEAARGIVSTETAARNAKTERLRAARLAADKAPEKEPGKAPEAPAPTRRRPTKAG